MLVNKAPTLAVIEQGGGFQGGSGDIKSINTFTGPDILIKTGNPDTLAIGTDGEGNILLTATGGGGGNFDPTASYVFSGNNQFTKPIQGSTTSTLYDFVVNGQNTPTFTAGEEYILFPTDVGGYVEFDLTLLGLYKTGATSYGEVTAKFSIEHNSSASYNNVTIKLLSLGQSGIAQNLTNLFTFTAYITNAPITLNGVTIPTNSIITTLKLNNTLNYAGTTNSIFARVTSNTTAAYTLLTGTSSPAVLAVLPAPIAGSAYSIKADTSLFQSSLDAITLGINPTSGLTQSLIGGVFTPAGATNVVQDTYFLLNGQTLHPYINSVIEFSTAAGTFAINLQSTQQTFQNKLSIVSYAGNGVYSNYAQFLANFQICLDLGSSGTALLYLKYIGAATIASVIINIINNSGAPINPAFLSKIGTVLAPTGTPYSCPIVLVTQDQVDRNTLQLNPLTGQIFSPSIPNFGYSSLTTDQTTPQYIGIGVLGADLMIEVSDNLGIWWMKFFQLSGSNLVFCMARGATVAQYQTLAGIIANYNFGFDVNGLLCLKVNPTATAGTPGTVTTIKSINIIGAGRGYLSPAAVAILLSNNFYTLTGVFTTVNPAPYSAPGSLQSINKDTTAAQQIVGDGSNINAETTNGTTTVKYIGTGGSSDPVIDLVPVTLVNGETVIAFFPLNQASGAKNLQWQTYGKVQGAVYSPNGTLAETSVIDFDVAAAYYSAENISVELNYNGGTYISNTEPSILSSLNNLQPKAYQMTIGTVTYCLITYQQSTVNSYLLQTQFSANLANDGGILAAKYVGELLSTITAPTPVLLSNFTYNVTPKTTKIQDIVAEQYTTNSFPVARGWVDGNNNPILQLPAQGGFNAGGAGIKTLNVYIVDFVSSNKSITYSTTANPAITTVAISGLIDGDVISDMTYIGTGDTNGSYYACSPNGNVYSSPANAAILFRVWSFVGNAGFALYSICNNGTSLVATGAGNNFYSNVTGNWQTKQFGSANVRTINCSSYMSNATGNIQGVGNVTGIWVFAGVTTTGGFTCLYYQPSMIYGGVVPIGAWGQSSCHSMVWTNNTNGILFACSSGNILTGGTTSFPLSYSSSVTSVSPSGVTSLDNFISITSDGTRAFVVDSYSGAIYWQLILATITGLWTKITLSNFVPTQVTSATTGANPTFISGALNSKAAIAVNASSALTPNFATELVPLYENRATIFASSSSDQRVATLGDIAALIQFMTGNTTKSLVDTLEEFRTYQLGHAEPLSTKIESMLKVNHRVIDVEYTVSKD